VVWHFSLTIAPACDQLFLKSPAAEMAVGKDLMNLLEFDPVV
jgi:hypothetical protein